MKIFILFWWLSIYVIFEVDGLRNVHMIFPKCLDEGDNVTLFCQYDLEGDKLYAVKWYRGRYEFYRYCPIDDPHITVFSIPGLVVDVSASSSNRVTLLNVPRHIGGNFTCEVSTDAPLFITHQANNYLDVVPKKEKHVTEAVEPQYLAAENLVECDENSLAVSKKADILIWTMITILYLSI